MEISFQDGLLTIDGTKGVLKSSQLGQLHYFGFLKAPEADRYVLAPAVTKTTLTRLCDYLDKEHVPFVLSSNCIEMLNSVRDAVIRGKETREKARNFKEGRYSQPEFEEFLRFVNGTIKRPLKEHQIKAAYHLYLINNGANFSVLVAARPQSH